MDKGDKSLKIWYRCEEGTGSALTDEMGNFNATISGATFDSGGSRVDGKKALKFTNGADYAEVGDVLETFNTGTLAAWIYLDSLPGATKAIISKSASGTPGSGYNLHIVSSNTLRGEWRTLNGGNNATSSVALVAEKWTHVATTYDGSNIRVYINGILSGTGAQTGETITNNTPLRIGANSAHLTSTFLGMVDDVRIYDRALNNQEIKNLVHGFGYAK